MNPGFFAYFFTCIFMAVYVKILSGHGGDKMIYKQAAKIFIKEEARPLEKALYYFYFPEEYAEEEQTVAEVPSEEIPEGPSDDTAETETKYTSEYFKNEVLEELKKFQNDDGGFGHGLEADNWNPNSNPIATNDALIFLQRIGALSKDNELVQGIVKYLSSLDSFDEKKKRWYFAIESNDLYPHASWWEKGRGDGIRGFNPTVSLAAFMVCFGEDKDFFRDLTKDAFEYLENTHDIQSDELKCFLLALTLLKDLKKSEPKHPVFKDVDIDKASETMKQRIEECVCPDTWKYGNEYVAMPSDFFAYANEEYLTDELKDLIKEELACYVVIQKSDGGFDISWKWYTNYKKEFETARKWWRPRLTIDKLLFCQKYDAEY